VEGAFWGLDVETRFGSKVSQHRALIVDDSEVLRRLIEMCLRPVGFEIATASTGAEALDTAASFHPDLVILDIGLPDMTGWEVLAMLRESAIGADAKVLILSGYEDINTDAKTNGADAALIKPFRNDELRALAVELAGPLLPSDLGAGTPA
jgi:two-component system OmpR family response regulator